MMLVGVVRGLMTESTDGLGTGLDWTFTPTNRTASGKGSLMFYNHSYVSTTADGKLNITTAAETTRWKGFNPYTKEREWFTKEFRGGMVNTWNKFCFSGAS